MLAAVHQLHHLHGELDIDDAAAATFQVPTGAPSSSRSRIVRDVAGELRLPRLLVRGVQHQLGRMPQGIAGAEHRPRLGDAALPRDAPRLRRSSGRTRQNSSPAAERRGTQTRIDFVQPAIGAEPIRDLDDSLPSSLKKC